MPASWDTKAKFAIVTGSGSGKCYLGLLEHYSVHTLTSVSLPGINHSFAEQLLNAGCSVVFADIALRPEAEATIAKFPYPPSNSFPITKEIIRAKRLQ